MSEQVQELINKIKSEGIQTAKAQAKEIEKQSREKVEAIIADAGRKARQMIVDAEAANKKQEESTKKILEQSARDMLLKLREEVQATLGKLVARDIKESLTAEHMHKYILEVAKGYLSDNKGVEDITVRLNDESLQKLKSGYLSKLKEQLMLPIVLRADEDMGDGFTISFDKGKSCFDFTDESLVEYFAGYLSADIVSCLKSDSSN